jgi:hypothetical protein
MAMLHIILKVGHPKIISTQISEQKILMWFLSHNIPKQIKLAEEISQTNPEYMSYGKIMLIILFMRYEYSWRRGTTWLIPEAFSYNSSVPFAPLLHKQSITWSNNYVRCVEGKHNNKIIGYGFFSKAFSGKKRIQIRLQRKKHIYIIFDVGSAWLLWPFLLSQEPI